VSWGIEDLEQIAGLGFGPASQLMTEPKLFVDARFLAALQVEFEEELGAEEARIALFQIGLLHGMRDAARLGNLEGVGPGLPELVGASPLAMQFGSIESGPAGLELSGCWPDAHEAEARLSKLGQSPHHACVLSAGYTSGWLTGTFEVDMLALETSCSVTGADGCTFRAREIEAWQRNPSDTALAREILARVPIGRLRNLTASRVAAATEGTPAARERPSTPLDTDDPAVHVWGPVMVMPFTDADTALGTIEMLGREPAMREVRVVVLDLGGIILDEGFGASGLEQVIANVEAWGADVILTGISPLSADIVNEMIAELIPERSAETSRIESDLEAPHLLIRKDLPEAIAYGFQIAEVHRHLL